MERLKIEHIVTPLKDGDARHSLIIKFNRPVAVHGGMADDIWVIHWDQLAEIFEALEAAAKGPL